MVPSIFGQRRSSSRSILLLVVLLCAYRAMGQSPSVVRNDSIASIIGSVSLSEYATTIQGLQAFGTRHSSQSNHDSVRAWVVARFLAMGIASVVTDSVPYPGAIYHNVIASLEGSDPAAGEIVVGAHFDSQSSIVNVSPGADDNASGVAAVIEMARTLVAAQVHPRHTVRFVAFDGEEQGLLGSYGYAGRMRVENRSIMLMQNYDMIGYRDQGSPDREVNVVWYQGSESQARLDSAVKALYTTLMPIMNTSYRSGSDSYPFFVNGFPAVFTIEKDFSPYYHSPRDSVKFLDLDYAVEITRAGLALLLTVDRQGATAVAEGTSLPGDVQLDPASPNPFNPATNLQYTIPDRRHVRLEIVDLLGRRVGVVVDGMIEGGTHRLRWSADGLSSGMYIARLQAGNDIRATRLILLR